jgi:hypothetical protein
MSLTKLNRMSSALTGAKSLAITPFSRSVTLHPANACAAVGRPQRVPRTAGSHWQVLTHKFTQKNHVLTTC